MSEISRPEVTIYTDGACSGNPGPGGYAAIMKFGPVEGIVMGYYPRTSNNRMELMAIIECVKQLKKPCNVLVKTDSQYACNALANLESRSKNGWRTNTGALCANVDLLQELYRVEREGHHHFQFLAVKAHSGNKENEKCDKLAKAQIKQNCNETKRAYIKFEKNGKVVKEEWKSI